MLQRIKQSGLASMVMASFIFSLAGVLLKYASPHFNTMEAVFIRSLLGTVYFLIYFYFRRIPPFGTRRHILLMRGLFGFCGLSLYFVTVSQIELANAVVLNRLSPLLVILLSAYLLDERISAKHLLLGALAFGGVLLIVKPGTSTMQWAALAGVGSAIASALAYITIKKASSSERISVIVFYFFWLATLLSAPSSIYALVTDYQRFTLIPGRAYLALSLMAVLSVVAQLFMTRSYSLSQAGKASLVTYISVLMSTILGYYFFSEMPDQLAIVGGILILLATALVTTLKELPKQKV